MHDFVNQADAYVKGRVHTNGMENFWRLLKRSLRGTYVAVEPFHLIATLTNRFFVTTTERIKTTLTDSRWPCLKSQASD